MTFSLPNVCVLRQNCDCGPNQNGQQPCVKHTISYLNQLNVMRVYNRYLIILCTYKFIQWKIAGHIVIQLQIEEWLINCVYWGYEKTRRTADLSPHFLQGVNGSAYNGSEGRAHNDDYVMSNTRLPRHLKVLRSWNTFGIR